MEIPVACFRVGDQHVVLFGAMPRINNKKNRIDNLHRLIRVAKSYGLRAKAGALTDGKRFHGPGWLVGYLMECPELPEWTHVIEVDG